VITNVYVPDTGQERTDLILDILVIMTYHPHQFRLLMVASLLPR